MGPSSYLRQVFLARQIRIHWIAQTNSNPVSYKIIYPLLKNMTPDTKYQSLPHERVACQAHAGDHHKIFNRLAGKCITVAKKVK